MILTISKSEIFKEVEKRSSLEGFVSPEVFDKVWANESKNELLDSYWIEGQTAIVQLFKKYLGEKTIESTLTESKDDEKFTISVDMPDRYNSLLDGSVSTDVKMMLACNILTGWMKVVLPESASKYDEEAKGYSEDLRVKMLYRIEPTATCAETAKTDGESLSVDEEALAAAKTDEVYISIGEEALEPAKVDDVAMVQGWGRECCKW